MEALSFYITEILLFLCTKKVHIDFFLYYYLELKTVSYH